MDSRSRRGFTFLSAQERDTTRARDVDNIQSKLGRETCQVAGNFRRPQKGFQQETRGGGLREKGGGRGWLNGGGSGGGTGKSISPAEVNASRVEAPVKLNCRKTLFLFLARKHAPTSLALSPSAVSPRAVSPIPISLSLLSRRVLPFFLSSSIHPASPPSVCAVDSCLHLFH